MCTVCVIKLVDKCVLKHIMHLLVKLMVDPFLYYQKAIHIRPYLNVVGLTSIHMCWSELGWNLVQVPLQSISTHMD